MWNLLQKVFGWFGQKAPGVIGNHFDRQLQAQWETDRALFEKLRTELPLNGSIDFVRNHPVGVSFHRDKPKELFEFLYYWNDAEHEFLDTELDAKRSQLYAVISEYLHVLGKNTWSIPKSDYQGIPEEWEWNQPERLAEVVRKIENLSTRLVECYDDLIRTGRRKLKC